MTSTVNYLQGTPNTAQHQNLTSRLQTRSRTTRLPALKQPRVCKQPQTPTLAPWSVHMTDPRGQKVLSSSMCPKKLQWETWKAASGEAFHNLVFHGNTESRCFLCTLAGPGDGGGGNPNSGSPAHPALGQVSCNILGDDLQLLVSLYQVSHPIPPSVRPHMRLPGQTHRSPATVTKVPGRAQRRGV